MLQLLAPIIILLNLISNALAIQLAMPLDCQLGKNCWISNLPEHIVKGKGVDFRCGLKTYPKHDGTDFALLDEIQMHEGVNVISPVEGSVKAVRDGMEDIIINEISRQSVKGNECGNSVILERDDYEVQLCHMRKGSIKVKVGNKVTTGQVIGQVGLSGLTEYPHLQVILRKKLHKNKFMVVDPFYGEQQDCGLKPESLWVDKSLLDSYSQTGLVYNYGFSFDQIDATSARAGKYRKISKPPAPKSIIGFVDIFSVDAGDKISFKITDDNGNELFSSTKVFNRYQARYFIYADKKMCSKKLAGRYHLKIEYKHANGKTDNFEKTINLES